MDAIDSVQWDADWKKARTSELKKDAENLDSAEKQKNEYKMEKKKSAVVK